MKNIFRIATVVIALTGSKALADVQADAVAGSANYFRAAFFTSQKCASLGGQQLGLVFSTENASGNVVDSYSTEIRTCVDKDLGASEYCKKSNVTGEARSASIRIGTLEYVLVDGKTGKINTASKGPIKAWLDTRREISEGLNWTDVVWSFSPNTARLSTEILQTPALTDAWLFGNDSTGFNGLIADHFNSNSFTLKSANDVEIFDGMGAAFSAQLLKDMLKGQKEINLYVKSCGGVVSAKRQ